MHALFIVFFCLVLDIFLSKTETLIIDGNRLNQSCPKNIFYCNGPETENCGSICNLESTSPKSRFIWMDTNFVYRFSTMVLSPVSSTLKVYTSWIHKSWPNVFLSRASSNLISISVWKGKRELISIRIHCDQKFQNIEICSKVYGVSYCNSKEITKNHFEDDSEPKPLLLAVQLDVANYILYFCSSVDLVNEICYYRVSIEEAKALDGSLYFQIEVDKESAIKINFDAIFHFDYIGGSKKNIVGLDSSRIFQNVTYPITNFKETFKMKETQLCSSIVKNMSCTIIPTCVDYTCRRKTYNTEVGHAFTWKNLEKEVFIDLENINMSSIPKIEITLCSKCRDGMISFLSRDNASNGRLKISTIHRKRKLVYQFMAILNGERMVFYHAHAAYKSVSVVIKFPFVNNKESSTCLETYKPTIFLSKGNFISMMGELSIDIHLWKGIQISGFKDINKIQIEHIFEDMQEIIPRLCPESSNRVDRIARTNTIDIYKLHRYPRRQNNSLYTVAICVSSIVTVSVSLALILVWCKYYKLRIASKNETIEHQKNLAHSGDNSGMCEESQVGSNVSKGEPLNNLRSHAKIPRQDFADTKKLFNKQRKIRFSNRISVATISK